MVSLQAVNLISIAVFCLIIAILLWRDRDNIERASIIFMRRTEHGIDLLDSIAGKFPRFWKYFSTLGVLVSFGAMFFIFYYLINNALRLFLVPNTQPALALVLPSPTTSTSLGPGYFAIPFWYWIISIATVVVAHEMMHGIIGRNEGFNIKSVGWVILGIIPGAFVEPEGEEGVLPDQGSDGADDQSSDQAQEESNNETEEEEDEQQGPWQQGSWISRLRVLAAGSFSNICLGVMLAVILLLATSGPGGVVPYEPKGVYDHQGVQIEAVFNKSAAHEAGLARGDVIKALDSRKISSTRELNQLLQDYQPGDSLLVTTAEMTYNLELQREQLFNYSYSPAPVDFILAWMEKRKTGTINNYEQSNNFLIEDNNLHRFYRWRWLAENYPQLKARAKEEMESLRQALKEEGRPAIGIKISNYRTSRINKLFLPLITFLQGLLVFMMAIHLGIGMANMLPVKPLDGGMMIETLQDRFLPSYDNLTRHVTYITLAIIIIIFALTAVSIIY